MTRTTCWLLALTAACAARPNPPPQPAASAAATPMNTPSSACAAAEFRQFDFWIGDWDLVLRARKSPDSEEWDEARAENHVRASLGGCVIEEHFRAEGPGTPWAGHSVSTYVPGLGAWRQTWVDDQGGYLAFQGRFENGSMILLGEPREKAGKTFQMRMVFSEITPQSLLWTWERGTPGGTEWRAVMTIRYTRKPTAGQSLRPAAPR